MNITFFGTYSTKAHPRIQTIIDGLRVHGINVVECNKPLPVDTAARVQILRQPWRVPLFGLAILRCWLGLVRLARHLPRSQALIVGHLGHFDIHLAKRLFPHQLLILDYMISGSGTAEDRQLSGGFKDKLLKWLDHAALKAADIVMVDTEEHRLALPEKFRPKALVVRVGAPQAWFDTPKPKQPAKNDKAKPLRIIFFGLYTPLQGAPVIGAALKLIERPVTVTMVGTGQDLEAAKRAATNLPPQVHVDWMDWVESSELPELVASHDVCLGIFGSGPKAGKVVPNKVYQGAAAGCAIVTADTEPQRRLLHDAALYVPVTDAKALSQTLDYLATELQELARLRQAAYRLARAEFMPQKIVEPLLETLSKNGTMPDSSV